MLACLVHLMVGPVAVVLGEEVVEAVHLVPVDQPVYDHVGALVGAVGGQGEHAVDLQPRQQPRARPGHYIFKRRLSWLKLKVPTSTFTL